ncbi:tRNA pseudouridine synthase D [Chiua virens]|nr:tRNA pseudouridine synthase D [Chiua virens]
MSTSIRDREDDDGESRSPKRTKTAHSELDDTHIVSESAQAAPEATSDPQESILPPSHALLGLPSPQTTPGGLRQLLECDVGISEYINRDLPPICGIIKQRFTDFLVNEVDLDHQVLHIKSLGLPEPSKKDKTLSILTEEIGTDASTREAIDVHDGNTNEQAGSSKTRPLDNTVVPNVDEVQENQTSDEVTWDDAFEPSLSPFLSESSISELKKMYLEGPEPPRVSDNGWVSRGQKKSGDVTVSEQGGLLYQEEELNSSEIVPAGHSKARGKGRQRGRGRPQSSERGDHRKILSEPISSKATRTALHQAVRKLFNGKLESETDMATPAGEEGSRISIKWSRSGGRGAARARGERAPRGEYPPYIHFTLQKTNRDTQDALAYLSRTLHVSVKDLGVAGTKDKRGVTVQRVSLRRGNKTVENVWKAANQIGRRSIQEAITQRGERGVRIADLNYRKAGLELGMLKGNEFVITLRNMQVDSTDALDLVMNSMKQKGFINYYGMQRFGTAAVPTHTIGLAFLRSDWHKAVSLILQVRPGEHPDVVAAREAWLVDRNLDRALALMPRRVVAERCILESYKKQGGETRNAMGALSTIPRNLRLMYIHAYQSYVWNAIVSERIRMHGADKAVPGDLVFEEEPTGKGKLDDSLDVNLDEPTAVDEHGESSNTPKKIRKTPWVPPQVKTLTIDDAQNYSIFDVIMPLPGRDVKFPGGPLGERYREFLRRDGLDPDNFIRKQKEYTLNGSYRKILQLPKNMTWSALRYTDPDVALAQADEDKLLCFDPPSIVENGRFMALQINLTLGTAAYATMALRELTKMETSSHFQTELTQASEDQRFRGTAIPNAGNPEEEIAEMEE